MPFINCKVELKLKWIKHYILATCGNGDDAHSNNIIFNIKDTKFYVPVVTPKENKNHRSLLAKDLKDQCSGMNIK